MKNVEATCQMKMDKKCSRDLKGTPKKIEEKTLLMHLNNLPKLTDVYSTINNNYINNTLFNSSDNLLHFNSPVNLQGVYIILSNLRI